MHLGNSLYSEILEKRVIWLVLFLIVCMKVMVRVNHKDIVQYIAVHFAACLLESTRSIAKCILDVIQRKSLQNISRYCCNLLSHWVVFCMPLSPISQIKFCPHTLSKINRASRPAVDFYAIYDLIYVENMNCRSIRWLIMSMNIEDLLLFSAITLLLLV